MQISQSTINKEKLYELDFVRLISALGIIIFHISCYTDSEAYKVLYKYSNGTYGNMFTMVFLLMSGGLLYHNYPQIDSLTAFYYKRWKSIFPPFYITFGYFYIKNVLAHGALFYYGHNSKILLSLLGLDGFFRYMGVNYYLVGEWFLGAIIILYILYPLLLKVVDKLGWLMAVVSMALCVWKVRTAAYGMVFLDRLAYYGGCFVMGMLIFKYRLYKNRVVLAISAAISVILLFVKINISVAYSDYLLGISFFFVLYMIGAWLIRISLANKVLAFLSGLTFPMFLVQNQISSYLVTRYNPISMCSVVKTIVISVILCVISSWCIKMLVSAITSTKWYKSIEAFIMSKSLSKVRG